jgi:ketosteroid isomerase-like protein
VQIDDPEVLAEIRTEFDRYERALVANDVEALVAFFREAPETVRYGIDDMQYGHDELAAFRRSQALATPPRALRRTVLTTFGRDFAVANTEFVPDGTDVVGRQSQTWLRTDDGWKIACAHVSWEGGRAP